MTIGMKNLKENDREAMAYAVQVYSSTLMPDKMFVTQQGLQPIIDDVAAKVSAAKGAPFARFVDSSLLEELDKDRFPRRAVERSALIRYSMPASCLARRTRDAGS